MTPPASGRDRARQPHDAQPGGACRRPDYVIVVSQLRGQSWSDGMSLDEALETGRTPSREAEADREAEP
jgi:hypothetical protein